MRLLLPLILAVWSWGFEYQVDNQKSQITFTATQFVFVEVDGHFGEFDGALVYKDKTLTHVNGVIKAASINTDIKERDDHLRSSDFFHAELYPDIFFESTEITGDVVMAKVTIKGITHTLPFKIVAQKLKDNRAALLLEAEVDRTLFTLDGAPISAVIDDEVVVKATIVAEAEWGEGN